MLPYRQIIYFLLAFHYYVPVLYRFYGKMFVKHHNFFYLTCIGAIMKLTPLEFHRDLWCEKGRITRLPSSDDGLSSMRYSTATVRRTDTSWQHMPRYWCALHLRRAVKVKMLVNVGIKHRRTWVLQKWPNRSRCHLWGWLGWAHGTM